jgi:hypothetical protein
MNTTHHPKLNIERYSADDLDAAQSRIVEEHCSICPSCNAYLAQLQLEKKHFLNVHPFSEFAKKISPQAGRSALPKLSDLLWRPVLVPVYGIIALALVALPTISFVNSQRASSDIAYKGAASLSFLCSRDGNITQGNPLDTFKAGDHIQVLYSSSREQNVALVSIDSKGTISFYQDGQNEYCSIKTPKGQNLSYPSSIVLDASTGQELVVALLSRNPLKAEAVRQLILKALGTDVVRLDSLASRLRASAETMGIVPQTLLLNKGQ